MTRRALFALFVLCCASTASAQQDYTGARAIGMGGAHRAIVTGSEALYLNPAGMSQTRRYAVEGAYLYDFGRETHGANVTIIDSITAAVAAGVGYSYVSGSREIQLPTPTGGFAPARVDRSGSIIQLALGGALSRNAWIGISGRYVDLSYGPRQAVKAVTVDAGLLYRVSPMVMLSAVGYGLTNTGSAEAPVALGLGVALGPPAKFQFALDWVLDFTTGKYLEDAAPPRESSVKSQIRAGFEWLLHTMFALRAGYFHDRVTRLSPDNGLGVGFTVSAPKSRFGMTAAFEQRFNNTSERQLVFALHLFL
jgi:hypothetical protein